MRSAVSFSLMLFLLQAVAAQDKDAEKLYFDLEKTLLAAKCFAVDFEYQLGTQKAAGTVILTRDNELKISVKGDYGSDAGRNATFVMISDGKQVAIQETGMLLRGQKPVWKTPKNFHTVVTTLLSRGGVWYSTMLTPRLLKDEQPLEVDKMNIKTSRFQSLPPEKVDGRDTMVIRFRFGEGEQGRDDAEVTLWIDAQTKLPVRRKMVLERDRSGSVSEVFKSFKLDPKIEAGLFALPK